MACTDRAHVGDIGFRIEVVVMIDDVTADDISSATVKKIKLKSPTGATKEFVADWVSIGNGGAGDGSDGKIDYTTTLATDLDRAGDWEVMAYLEMPTWTGHTCEGILPVDPVL